MSIGVTIGILYKILNSSLLRLMWSAFRAGTREQNVTPATSRRLSPAWHSLHGQQGLGGKMWGLNTYLQISS